MQKIMFEKKLAKNYSADLDASAFEISLSGRAMHKLKLLTFLNVHKRKEDPMEHSSNVGNDNYESVIHHLVLNYIQMLDYIDLPLQQVDRFWGHQNAEDFEST